ncbi:MAG TPA: succinylglutamate desuccinylase/aspartoacylase family protein, partial [Aquabacterium sp.]|nr:succinylglutamate desuccinylase/aspartoacylase family protein [Aquabacterium sp.]
MTNVQAPSVSLVQHQFNGRQPGPRLIILGAVHGNETCGTRAIERLLHDLKHGALSLRCGLLTLVPVCNPLAYEQGRREGDRNLNRRLQPTVQPMAFEDHVANALCPLLAAHDVLLDLHSFHTPGDPFVMIGPPDNTGTLEPFAQADAEARLARHLGVTRGVEGWL